MTAKELIDILAKPEPTYDISGAILGCLGDNRDKVLYDVVEDLPDDPWEAIIKSKGSVTKDQLQDWHNYHTVDVDKKGVPYYFIVTSRPDNKEFVWYSDDANMLPIGTEEEKKSAIQRGLDKGLIKEQLDF